MPATQFDPSASVKAFTADITRNISQEERNAIAAKRGSQLQQSVSQVMRAKGWTADAAVKSLIATAQSAARPVPTPTAPAPSVTPGRPTPPTRTPIPQAVPTPASSATPTVGAAAAATRPSPMTTPSPFPVPSPAARLVKRTPIFAPGIR